MHRKPVKTAVSNGIFQDNYFYGYVSNWVPAVERVSLGRKKTTESGPFYQFLFTFYCGNMKNFSELKIDNEFGVYGTYFFGPYI